MNPALGGVCSLPHEMENVSFSFLVQSNSLSSTCILHVGSRGHNSSVLVEQEARECAVLPAAAIDGAAVQPQPHLVSLVQLQDGVVAGRLVVRSPVVGVRRHHHLVVAHQVDVERHVDRQLEDVEEEDVGAIGWAGETTHVGVEHFPQVAVELVKGDGLVQGARGVVGCAGCCEGHAEGLGILGERVNGYVHQGVGGMRGEVHANTMQRVAVGGVHQGVVALPVWAAHLGGVTPTTIIVPLSCIASTAPVAVLVASVPSSVQVSLGDEASSWGEQTSTKPIKPKGKGTDENWIVKANSKPCNIMIMSCGNCSEARERSLLDPIH